MKPLVFMDFEASALWDGYPIEVGWAWAEGAHVEARSLLIARTERWRSSKYQWDTIAEKIHGLSLERLEQEGRTVDFVCQALNEALGNSEISFDTGPAGIDRRWLQQLYAESVIPCALQVAANAADTLTINNAQRLGIGDVAWTLIEKLAPPLTHAASDDAAHWAWWQIAIERVVGAGFGGIADQSDRGLEAIDGVVGGIEIRYTGRTRHAVVVTK